MLQLPIPIRGVRLNSVKEVCRAAYFPRGTIGANMESKILGIERVGIFLVTGFELEWALFSWRHMSYQRVRKALQVDLPLWAIFCNSLVDRRPRHNHRINESEWNRMRWKSWLN